MIDVRVSIATARSRIVIWRSQLFQARIQNCIMIWFRVVFRLMVFFGKRGFVDVGCIGVTAEQGWVEVKFCGMF